MVIYCLPEISGNFGQIDANEETIWSKRPVNFRNKRNVLKGSLKFLTKIPEWKMCSSRHLESRNYDQVELVLGSLGKFFMANPHGS